MRRILNLWPAGLALAAVMLVIGPPAAMAFGSIADDWQAEYPDACQDLQDAAVSCNLCHATGFALNPYGSDLADNGRDFAVIEPLDSDGDGRTNLQEIMLDCTLPGDAAAPVDDATWSNIKTLFR